MIKKIDDELLDIPAFLRNLEKEDSKPNKKNTPTAETKNEKQKIAWPPTEEPKEVKKEEKPKKPKVDIQARMQSQTQNYIIDIRDINYATFDNELHELSIQSVYEYCKEENIPMAYCSRLIDDVEGFKKEYEWILKIRSTPRSEQTDEEKDLGEGYDSYSNKEMKQMANIQDKAIEQIYRWSKIKQGEKKARKPRAMSIERMIKKLQYKKDDSKYKIQSVDPILIPRCQQLWVFNTKTRKLSQYNAISRNGIMIKGTSLKDFDTTNSVSKTVRKPDLVLPKLLTTDGKTAIKNIWNNIKTTDTKANGRINVDTILFKVLK